MAKQEKMHLLLLTAVVLGMGEKARSFQPGETVEVVANIGKELVSKGGGIVVAAPADPEMLVPKEVSGPDAGSDTKAESDVSLAGLLTTLPAGAGT